MIVTTTQTLRFSLILQLIKHDFLCRVVKRDLKARNSKNKSEEFQKTGKTKFITGMLFFLLFCIITY